MAGLLDGKSNILYGAPPLSLLRNKNEITVCIDCITNKLGNMYLSPHRSLEII
jgi:hypothetical protein